MPEIRALTLHQPWASLIAWGVKRYETRPRPLSYRGPLAIHAGMAWTKATEIQAHNLFLDLWRDWHLEHMPEEIPLGCVVAVADLVDCQRMTDDRFTCGNERIRVANVSEAERLCGDWRPGRYAYRLENVRRLETPIPVRGKQGLWRIDLPEEVLPRG